ncbi:MAG: SpoIIE family protein phosphatase [Phycisphaeraceae bacterium]|nr:SpoIIE family protein phosphatase [Phycisphaerales bacterium]MCB9859114.1 SpoIIE family protein phosphatase [Phycisphaeraceae bacterium]
MGRTHRNAAPSFCACIAVSSYTPQVDLITRSLETNLVNCWSDDEQLSLVHSSIDDVFSAPESSDLLSCQLVCVCDPALDASEINRLMSRVRSLDRVSIMLCHAQHINAISCAHPNVLLLPLDTPAEQLASAMRGTSAGQSLVDAVLAELAIVQSSTQGAVRHMEQVNEELQLAGQIQQELMPKDLPEVDGADIGVLFQPVGFVSGDVYGVREVAPGVVWFFLADAVGHGMPAALLSVLICRAMNKDADIAVASKSSYEDSPAARIAHLNTELSCAGAGRGRFATAIAGSFDANTNTLKIACAGHPPALLAGLDGSNGYVKEVDAAGPMLGVFPEAQYEDLTLTLTPGQSLLIYSDGFETAFPDDEEANKIQRRGSREYVNHFANLPWPTKTDGCLQNVVNALRGIVGGHAGSLHQADDLTALVIAPKAAQQSRAAA